VVALANPGFLIGSLGYSIGVLGAWGAVAIWTASMFLGGLHAVIYQELALMFPRLSGGIAVYGHQAWKRYSSAVGALTSFGYWFGWSSVLAIFGLLIGTLAQAEYWPGATWSIDVGLATFGLPKLIAVIVIAAVWFANTRGMRVTVGLTYAAAALLLVPLGVIMVGSFVSGDFHSANLTWSLPAGWDGWKLALVWLYLMCWSSYGVETCATFAPEYLHTKKDTAWALRSSSLFNLAVYVLLPLGVVGTLTSGQVADGAGGAYIVQTLRSVIGAGSGIATALLIAGLLLAMNTATMDASRALFGVARDGLQLKGLGRLNKHNVPGVAMTVDAVVNIALLFLFDSTLGILAAGNLGYVLAHIAALSGFLLLRKDRPDLPRPIRLAAGWLPVAAALLTLDVLFAAVGFVYFDITGYSSGVRWLGVSRELWVGVLILVVGLALFAYRRLVQDRAPVSAPEAHRTR
jgi:amino acid transporter